MSIKSKIGYIAKKNKIAYNLGRLAYNTFVLEVLPILSLRAFKRKKLPENFSFMSMQSLSFWHIDEINVPSTDLFSLINEKGIKYTEGGWTYYLPPSHERDAVFPQLSDFSTSVGLKIIKAPGSVADVNYTSAENREIPGSSSFRMRTPDCKTLARIAKALHRENLGPDIYDLCEINYKGDIHVGFVVEHIDSGSVPNHDHFQEFEFRLKAALKNGVISEAHGSYKLSSDFSAPLCNGNLIVDKNNVGKFVDFQSFIFQDEAKGITDILSSGAEATLFGPKRMRSKPNYLYQEAPLLGPGKRSTIDRWEKMDVIFDAIDCKIEDKVTYDIGCNLGLMSYYALNKGAKFSCGWDRHEVARISNNFMGSLGATRWRAFGCDLQTCSSYRSDVEQMFKSVKDDGILFYLAIHRHIGFPKSLLELKWTTAIVEGHSGETIEKLQDLVRASSWKNDVVITHCDTILDGDSPIRPLLVLSRNLT